MAAEVLNRARKADPEAVDRLIFFRTPCNQELANDPSIVVGDTADGKNTDVSMVGILNGILTELGQPLIYDETHVDEPEKVLAFGEVAIESLSSTHPRT